MWWYLGVALVYVAGVLSGWFILAVVVLFHHNKTVNKLSGGDEWNEWNEWNKCNEWNRRN